MLSYEDIYQACDAAVDTALPLYQKYGWTLVHWDGTPERVPDRERLFDMMFANATTALNRLNAGKCATYDTGVQTICVASGRIVVNIMRDRLGGDMPDNIKISVDMPL